MFQTETSICVIGWQTITKGYLYVDFFLENHCKLFCYSELSRTVSIHSKDGQTLVRTDVNMKVTFVQKNCKPAE